MIAATSLATVATCRSTCGRTQASVRTHVPSARRLSHSPTTCANISAATEVTAVEMLPGHLADIPSHQHEKLTR